MSDRPAVATKSDIIRADLAVCFRGYPRLIRAFENLLKDVATTIPDAVASNADEVLEAAAIAQSTAAKALGLAGAARDAATMIADGPPRMSFAQPPTDDMTHLIHELRARVALLERDLANLKEGPKP